MLFPEIIPVGVLVIFSPVWITHLSVVVNSSQHSYSLPVLGSLLPILSGIS